MNHGERSTRLRDTRLWMLLQRTIRPESHSRATKNYPQSRGAAQVVCLPRGTLGRCGDQDGPRNPNRAPGEQPGDLLGLRQAAPGYDRLGERRFEYVPLWQIAVYFVYAMRRVNCPNCGVKVERVPWCDGKNQLTTTYSWFLAGWAKRLSWKGVAEAFGTTWQNVFRSVKHAVSWGLAHRDLRASSRLANRRSAVAAGPQVPDVGLSDRRVRSKRLLWIGKDRTTKTFLRFFRMFGKERSGQTEVRLQRHVEGLLESDRQEGGPKRSTSSIASTSCRR